MGFRGLLVATVTVVDMWTCIVDVYMVVVEWELQGETVLVGMNGCKVILFV